jgi:hypothetical protein
MFNHFISASCGGEYCGLCWRNGIEGVPATHKVGEEIPSDTPIPAEYQKVMDEGKLSWTAAKIMMTKRHNLTEYVCCLCFADIFGSAAQEMCSLPTVDNRAEEFK